MAAQMLFNTIKTTLISLEEKGTREPKRLRIAVIECSHTHALKELLTETCLCGVLLIHMWGKDWTLCFLKPHSQSTVKPLPLFHTHTHTQSHFLHTCSFSARNRYDNGGALKTLPLLISSLNASICVFTFTCIWKYSSWILLGVHLCIPPSGFWSLKEITILPSISYQGAQLSASTYLSFLSLLLPFYPFVYLSWFFFALNCFSEIRLISSLVPCIYDEAFMNWAYLTTHAYSCGCNCLIALCYVKISYINRLPLPRNPRSCANVCVCLSK